MTATEEPHPEIEDAYLRREFDAEGRLRAEGHVDRRAWSANGAVGYWRLFAPDGSVRGEVDFEPLADPPKEGVADVAETLLAWQGLPTAAWLDGADGVAWADQEVYDGLPEHLPFHLNGLSSPRDDVFGLAMFNLRRAFFAQGTVAAAAKAAAPYLVAAAASLDGQHRDRVVELLWELLSGGGYLNAAERDLRARRSTPVGAVRAAVAAEVDRWRQLAGDGNAWAARLLPLAGGGGVVPTTTEPLARAELTLALSLERPADDTMAWLRDQLRDPDERQRFCAALALARLGDAAGVEILVGGPPPGCKESFWIGYDPRGEAHRALGRLDEGLPTVLAAFGGIPTVSAISVAGALVDTAFRERTDTLTDRQRQVLRALVDHERIWDFVNMSDLLERHGLPADREALAAYSSSS